MPIEGTQTQEEGCDPANGQHPLSPQGQGSQLVHHLSTVPFSPSLLPPEKVEMGYQKSQRASAIFPHLLILCLGVTCSPVTLGERPFPDPNPGGLSLVLKPPNFLTPQKNLFELILSNSWMLHVAVWEGSSVSSFPSPLHFHQKEVLPQSQTEGLAPRTPA